MSNQSSLLEAVESALAGDWSHAHEIAQSYSDHYANWIHAVLHKIEGDVWNSKYWYGRTAGRSYEEFDDSKQELLEIQHLLVAENVAK